MDISEKNKIILKNIDDNFQKPYSMNHISNINYDNFNIALIIKEIILNLKYNISYCFSNNYIREFIILTEYEYRLEKILYEFKFIYVEYYKYFHNDFFELMIFQPMIQNIKNILNDNKIKILYKNEYSEEISELIKSSNQLIDYFIINMFENDELSYYIIKYKQQEFKISKLKEELMANVWHPRNFNKFKYLDPEIFGDEIFGDEE
jgi:hypothetical protein